MVSTAEASMYESLLGVLVTMLMLIRPGFCGADDERPPPGARLPLRLLAGAAAAKDSLCASAPCGLALADLLPLASRGIRVGVPGFGYACGIVGGKAVFDTTDGEPAILGKVDLLKVPSVTLLKRFDRGWTGIMRFDGVREPSSMDRVSSLDTVDAGRAFIWNGGKGT